VGEEYPQPPGGHDRVPPPPGQGDHPLQARGVGEIIGTAFEIYRRNASQLLMIVAIIVVPLSILNFLLVDVVLAPRITKTVSVTGQTIRVVDRSFWLFVLGALIAAAIGVIINAILQAALLRGAAQASLGDTVDVQTSYRWGLRRFGSVLLVSLLVGLSVGVGFILLIVPGLFLLVMFSVAVPAMVVEDARGRAAMKRSWGLVKGQFWHTAGVIAVAFLITIVVSAILGAIGGDNKTLSLIFDTLGRIIVAPFSAVVTVLLYLDLRARRETLTASQLRSELVARD
jgi:hypothetical protein